MNAFLTKEAGRKWGQYYEGYLKDFRGLGRILVRVLRKFVPSTMHLKSEGYLEVEDRVPGHGSSPADADP
jgi:hypothetical protein